MNKKILSLFLIFITSFMIFSQDQSNDKTNFNVYDLNIGASFEIPIINLIRMDTPINDTKA
jgi:hypothetical protein